MKSKLAVVTLALSITSLQSAVAQANPAGPAAPSNTPAAPTVRTHYDTFAYIAVTPTAKGKTIWLEPVTDKDYKSVK